MDFINKYLKDHKNLIKYKSTGKEDRVILRDSGAVVVFPIENPYLMNQLLTGFGRNDKAYDFTAYDKSLARTYLDGRRVEMMCMRLLYPVDLDDAAQQDLRARITAQLPKVLTRIAREKNMTVLHLLEETGLFTEENIDEAIDALSGAGNREMMASLMGWKNRHVGHAAYDFAL